MQKQKLHLFCNRSSPDDGPKSGRKYKGYIRKIHKSIPAEYHKSNTVVLSSTCSCWIHTDAIKKRTQEDFFMNISTSPFIARVRKGCVGFYCERELETEQKL